MKLAESAAPTEKEDRAANAGAGRWYPPTLHEPDMAGFGGHIMTYAIAAGVQSETRPAPPPIAIPGSELSFGMAVLRETQAPRSDR